MTNAPLANLMAWYETLSPETLVRIGDFYTQDAYFRDPFNEVQGIRAIHHILQSMFARTDQPRFSMSGQVGHGDEYFVLWRFDCGLAGRRISVEGSSQLKFDSDGKIYFHRDYWDASELFAQLPVLGGLIRWLKRKMA
jgi:steroid delta-isomerase